MITVKVSYDEFMESPLVDSDYHITYNTNGRHLLGDMPVTWDEMEAIAADSQNVCLPVYTYIHGGVAMQTSSFHGQLPQGHARFDSGQSGVIFISKADIRAAYGVKRITAKTLHNVQEGMKQIVREFGQWVNGENYHIELFDEDGELFDFTSLTGDYEDEIARLRARHGEIEVIYEL